MIDSYRKSPLNHTLLQDIQMYIPHFKYSVYSPLNCVNSCTYHLQEWLLLWKMCLFGVSQWSCRLYIPFTGKASSVEDVFVWNDSMELQVSFTTKYEVLLAGV